MTVFSEKLNSLPATVEQACAADVSSLAQALRTTRGATVVAVGSGGSAVAAEMLAACRSGAGLGPTLVCTPMEYVLDVSRHGGLPVWLFSAGGDNPDVRAALSAAILCGAPSVEAVTANAGGEVVRSCASAPHCRVHLTPVADPKDGFLATHSLLSAATLLVRATDEACEGDPAADRAARLRAAAERVLGPDHRRAAAGRYAAAAARDMLLLLHDPLLKAAGVLIETSFWEAGVASVQRVDFRNFAHGRHAGLHRWSAATAITALATERSRPIWGAVDGLIPDVVPRVGMEFGRGGRQDLFEAVLEAFALVEAFGAGKGLDPGRPGVPDFGRAIYAGDELLVQTRDEDRPVRRKRAAEERADPVCDAPTGWVQERQAFLHDLRSATFGALVLDYDGTVVETNARWAPPGAEVQKSLVRLLDGGLRLAFASGRGGSLGETLRPLVPERHWDAVLVGYYNGGHVTTLRTDLAASPPEADPGLAAVAAWLDARAELFEGAGGFKFSGVQITIHTARLKEPAVFPQVLKAAHPGLDQLMSLRRSAHSYDLTLRDASKLRVLDEVERALGPDLSVLCVGDSGTWTGNDHELLSRRFSLSVGEVCHRPGSCWNLSPEGLSGPAALVRILDHLAFVRTGAVQLDVDGMLTMTA